MFKLIVEKRDCLVVSNSDSEAVEVASSKDSLKLLALKFSPQVDEPLALSVWAP